MSMEESSKRRSFFSSPDELFDEEYYDEQLPEKKRRLSPEQVCGLILADTPSVPICLRSYYTYLLSSKTLYSFMIWHVRMLCYITYVLKPYPHHIHFVGNWNMCVMWLRRPIFDQLLWNIFGIKDYSCRHVKVVSRI